MRMKIGAMFPIFAVFAVLFFASHTQAKGSGKLVEIQSVNKTRVTGWVFEKGAGTRIVKGIELKFKINQAGNVQLPILYTCLYDKDKNLVKKVEAYLISKGTRYIPGTDRFFKGKKTQVIVFPYENEVQFKYYLVVAGKQGSVSVRLEPKGSRIEDFTFDERGQL